MRAYFFSVILNHEVPDDTLQRLEMLKSLTVNGKDITHFEESIGKFMLDWIPLIVEKGLINQYLEILVNIIKFNASNLNKEIIVGIVQ